MLLLMPAPHSLLLPPADCALLRGMYADGYEIADHTMHHYQVRVPGSMAHSRQQAQL